VIQKTQVATKIQCTTFPTRLKYSVVKPLFKRGDREKMANYRPISLLTPFSKVFKKIIYQRLLQHINFNNVLAEEQFGFRPATSTGKASNRLMNEILSAMKERWLEASSVTYRRILIVLTITSC
jgi:hypothetical protein